MTFFYICLVLFVVMLVAPLLIGVLELRREESKALFIDLERKRDIRYFANAFTAMIEKALESYSGSDELMLSRPEKVVRIEGKETTEDEYLDLVLALDDDLRVKENTYFRKEIYSKFNIEVEENVELRAVCAKKKAVIHKGVNISRWIDSEDTLSVYDGCDLGVSATSANRITLGKDVTFKRLFSPMIQFGVYPEMDAEDDFDGNYKYSPEREKEVKHNLFSITKNDTEDGVYPYSVVTKYNLEVYNDLEVDGDLSSAKDVVIMTGSVIYGSIFAEGNVFLRKGVRILGNVFSQKGIYCEKDVIIGSRLNTVSVLAKEIVEFGERNIVYGFINAEGGGVSVKQYAQANAYKKYIFSNSLPVEDEYDFNEIDYDTFDKLVLRKNPYLKKVIFNENDKVIDRSILFGCTNIEEIIVPSTIETIEAFAFAELKNLKKIDLSECLNLKYIGDEAFRKCESLEEVTIPRSVKFIGEAAFIGCTSLRKVRISRSNEIIYVGNYAFSSCERLDQSFATRIANADPELIFIDAKMSSDDSDLTYFDDINRFSEAAMPVVYGKDDDARHKIKLTKEQRKLRNINKRILAFRETPISVYLAIIVVATIVLFNVEPHIEKVIQLLLPVEEFNVKDLINNKPEYTEIDILSRSQNIILINDELYAYDDRILKIFEYKDTRIEREVEGVRTFLGLFPVEVNRYYVNSRKYFS